MGENHILLIKWEQREAVSSYLVGKCCVFAIDLGEWEISYYYEI
jgi:hypothetical protein